MNADSWIYSIILVINLYDTTLCQFIIEDPDDTHNFTKCGDSTLASTVSPLILNGTVTQIGNFPWHAGLYFRQEIDKEESWKQQYGGSLLTDQFVLTAAHCVFNTNEKDVRVALGKIHRSWDRYEYGQQKSNVSKILYPYDFQEGSYIFDIALLLLEKKIKLGNQVMPVCSGLIARSEDLMNKKLFVVGWGQTKNVQSGSPSETLLYNDVSFLPKEKCIKFLPPGFVMFDKFCTVKNNNTEASVAQGGDIGGGLTVIHDGKHYIVGIVSIRITRLHESQVTLFTNITWPNHISWVEKEVGKYQNSFKWSENEKDSSRGCVLENLSPYRRFCSLDNGCNEGCYFDNAGCLVSPGSGIEQVKVVCAPGYSTRNTSSTGIALCLRNKWYPSLPECYKMCHPLKSEMLLLTCRLGLNIVDCSKPALPETTVSFECAPSFAEYGDLRRYGAYRKVHTCKLSGEWSDSLPPCKPACGVFNQNLKVLTSTIIGGQEAHLGFFPWHAGLYIQNEKDGKTVWEQRCAGTLITNRFTLTTAHCVREFVDDVSKLRVGLGKYYRSWDANESSEQKFNVTAISIPPQYNIKIMTFDIALMLLSDKIRFGEFVMPVCLDLDPEREDFQNNSSYVVGWGYTNKDKEPSEVLLYNTVDSIMSEEECRRAVPTVVSTFEKICARKENSESVVQRLDSGGGLTAIYRDGLHYLIGITSSKIRNISLFTNVKWKYHVNWMEEEMRRLEKVYLGD